MVDVISDDGLREVFASAEFRERVSRLFSEKGRITSAVSQATLYGLSRLLAPADILEIGSYFGNTSRVLAQSLADAAAGSLVTIDPFGGDRLPGIIEGWPEPLSRVTTFHALNSMSYFASLEIARTPTGRGAPFNLVFVDGHHSYEYALFDLLSSALYLRPGGAIVVDNVEQAGPAMAVGSFLSRYRAWRLFSQSGRPLDPSFPESVPDASGAILLSPGGVEISPIPYKFHFYGLDRTEIRNIALRLVPTSARGTVSVSANLHSVPYNLHLTGEGLVFKIAHLSSDVRPHADHLDLTFDGLAIQPFTEEGNINLELEVRFHPDREDGANIIVDVAEDGRLT
jgi:predicted O-methyltransferase YrrM